VDINQVYRAPSIPKLSKRNISSPVLRGAAATTAAKPKLTRSRFSFLKPKISAESLKTEAPAQGINETLAETNQILVEIQKQLSLDFAMRIAEEKETLKKVKETESKRKFALKEKSVEAVKKIGGTVGGVINKVTAPVKSIFDKIKEFFGLILTGIVLNAAFKWIQKDENRQKLEKIFNFVGTYWKEILGTIVGIQIASTIASVAGTLGMVFTILTNPFFLKAAALIGAAALFMYGQQKIGELQEKAREKEIEGIEKRTGKPVSAEKKKVLGERDLQLRTSFSQEQALGVYLSSFFRGQGKSKGGTIDIEPKNSVRGYKNGGTFWERMSGTVRGAGSMMVDSVKALLAPGEEIIRATSAMLFRPLLKDINDNAGRLWVEFSNAVKKLYEVSSLQTDISKEFAEVIEDFDEYLKADITKKRIGTGGGYARSKQTSIKPPSKVESNITMNLPSGGGMTFLPMVLPKQSSKPPEIPQMKDKATDVSVVFPINVSNYWMDVTPELYGIQLYT